MLKYVQVFFNNKGCAGLNENKEVSFSKNSWTFELCLSIHVCIKKRKFMLCMPKMQIALVPIQRKIKFNMEPCGMYESELEFAPKYFNLVPSFPGYDRDCSTFNFSLMLLFSFSVFVFFLF